ncbi:MAG TPA: hypothetical protein DCL34_04985 [Erythrobacter sp.]|nr:hypothetical protein [Erythrobacter sp.]
MNLHQDAGSNRGKVKAKYMPAKYGQPASENAWVNAGAAFSLSDSNRENGLDLPTMGKVSL